MGWLSTIPQTSHLNSCSAVISSCPARVSVQSPIGPCRLPQERDHPGEIPHVVHNVFRCLQSLSRYSSGTSSSGTSRVRTSLSSAASAFSTPATTSASKALPSSSNSSTLSRASFFSANFFLADCFVGVILPTAVLFDFVLFFLGFFLACIAAVYHRSRFAAFPSCYECYEVRCWAQDCCGGHWLLFLSSQKASCDQHSDSELPQERGDKLGWVSHARRIFGS